jgi:nucleoside-diphosphate-sugar epimerase
MNNTELHVIFGTGPVGKSVMTELLRRGKRVRMVNRSGKADVPAGVEMVAGNAADPAFTRQAAQGASVVYNCTNPPYTQWPELFPPLNTAVIEGAAANNAKLVVMENVYMYGSTHGKTMTEDMPYAATNRKGSTRAKMAQEVLDAHRSGKVRTTSGRAGNFFGPGVIDSVSGERMFVPALTGKTVQMLGSVDHPHTYTYVPDVGKALVILGERDEALGQAWHIPSPQTVTSRQFIEMIAAHAGQQAKIQAVPRLMLKGLALFMPMMREFDEMWYEFNEPHVIDDSMFKRAFGDVATPLPEAIRTTAQYFQDHPQEK